MKISGFSFVHNALIAGYPIVEAVAAVRPYVDEIVVVDIESNDGTTEILYEIADQVFSSPWKIGYDARETTCAAYQHNIRCSGDIIVFFEADEVFDDLLIRNVVSYIKEGYKDIGVWRLQVSQNFQRVRWYPIPVHRIFPKGFGSYIHHPVQCPKYVKVLPPDTGFLWDVSNCFRDQWFARKTQQSEIFGGQRSLMVRQHFTEPVEIMLEKEEKLLKEPHWTWTNTPLNIPNVLRHLVGKTRYEVKL